MLKINPILFNIFLSLYVVGLNYFSMINFISLRADDNYFFIVLIVFYFVLVFTVIQILNFFRFFAYIFSIILIFATGFSMYFVKSYGAIIDSEMIYNLFATDFKEAYSYFSFDFVVYVVLVVLLPLVLLKFIDIKKALYLQKTISLLFSLLVLLFLIFAFSKSFLPFLRANDDIRYFNVPFYQFYALNKLYKNHKNTQKQIINISQDAIIEDDKLSKTFILVVGETARAKNYSLGGYTKNDTNFYTKDLGVYYFSNFSSCGTATAQSLPCMFSIHNRVDFSKSENYENVLSVLNRFIDVHWLDNNTGGCKGVCNGIKSNIKSLDYDGWMIDEVKDILKNKNTENTLIVVHLQGSHGPSYYLRYPKEFEKFKPICNTNKLQECSEEALYNTYDNTLLYTDYLIFKLIKLLKNDNADKKALFYMSDHGESLGENGFYLHGIPYAIAPKEQTHIPAILWQNDEYINKKKLNYELSHDNLFSSLLGFFNVLTKDYNKTYDIFNEHLENNQKN